MRNRVQHSQRHAPDPDLAGADETAARSEGSGGVQSVDRAVTILEILSQRGEAGVSEVAAEIGVHKSTAFRLLGALEARGLAEQAEDRGKYRLGFGIVRLAAGVAARLDLVQQSRPVSPASRRGDRRDRQHRRRAVPLRHQPRPGARPGGRDRAQLGGPAHPLHATSSGKVLLAHLDERRRERLIAAAGLERFTPATVTDAGELRRQLAEALRQGYAVTVEEYEIGLNAIAAPIRSHEGEVVAAVSASGPAYRFSEERMHELAPVLVAGAADISHRLGHGG